MSRESKFIIGAFIVTILLVVGLTFLVTTKQKTEAAISTNPVEGIESNPQNYDLGNVPYSGGLVTKEYEIKNSSGKDIKLLKIATSCMCTTASIIIGGKESSFYGMEMTGVVNPTLSLTVKNGETAKVTTRFDPAAHGLAGLGQVQRSVWLYFDGGMKELTFNGDVIQ